MTTFCVLDGSLRNNEGILLQATLAIAKLGGKLRLRGMRFEVRMKKYKRVPARNIVEA